jgi:hypothetical protein
MSEYPQLCSRPSLTSSRLLLDEPPIALSPTLARTIGLPEAVFLQQLHYWLAHKARDPNRYRDYFIDGRLWVKWTREELMSQIPLGRSSEPHKRVIKALKELNVLLVEQHLRSSWNQSNFYSIDYPALEALLDERLSHQCSGVKDFNPEASKNPLDRGKDTDTNRVKKTDHCTETSFRDNTEEKIPPPRTALVLTELPAALREEVAKIVPQGNLGQDFVDLLVARLKRDKLLPAEQQLQYPLSWLKTMMQKSELDFTPAKKIASDRAARERTSLAAASQLPSTPKDTASIQDRLSVSMQFIKNASSDLRAGWLAKYPRVNTGRNARPQVEAAILNGITPQGRYAQELVCNLIESVRGEKNASSS